MYAYVLSIKGQIFCMLVLLYIAGIYFFVKRRRTSGHRLFSALLLVSIVYMAFDMITVYTINHVHEISIGLNHFCHIIYMSSMTAALYVFFLYLRYLAYGNVSFKFYHAIPLLVSVLASTFLPFEYEESVYGNYSWGPFAMVAFVSAYFYLLVGVVILFRCRKRLDKKTFHAIAISMIVVFGTAVLQGEYPTLLISGIGITLVVLALFYTVESPDAILIETLAKERERADSANRAKSIFLAQMSHDIRTPINAILGMNEMILRETADEDIRDYSRDIQTAGKTLLSLINTILDFSKIEDGKMELVIVKYDLATFVKNIELSVNGRARTKGLSFEVNVDEKLPTALYGDDVRLTKIITNLLTNAIKYTEKGSVRFDIKKLSDRDDEVLISVAVADTGIGIKPEDLDNIYKEFNRLDEERNRNIDGVGLGMAIVANLLKMMDSSLKVESTYGKGSVFSFSVVQKIADATPIGDYNEKLNAMGEDRIDQEEFMAPDARVLIVDDNTMNLKVAKKLLQIFGIEPDLAESGEECIEKVKSNYYHFIGLDHMMPGLSGIETLEKLREGKILPEDTRVLAMTANAVAGAKEMYISAGFDDYVSKPIELDSMKQKLLTYLPADIIRKKGKDIDFEVLEFEPAGGDDEAPEFEPAKDAPAIPVSETDIKKLLSDAGVDVAAGLMYCADDMDFYTEVLGDYVKWQPQKTDQLNEFYKSGDIKNYGILIHALKNTSRTVGLSELGDLAFALEQAAKNNDTAFIDENHEAFVSRFSKAAKDIEDSISHRG